MEVEQKIHVHSRDGSNGTFKPTAFAREIQRLTDPMDSILVDECAGKGGGKPRILANDHDSALSAILPRDGQRMLIGSMQM